MKFYQNDSNYSGELNYGRQSNTFQFEEDLFAKNAQGISRIFHKTLLTKKVVQTRPQPKSMNKNNYDSFCTVIKNSVEVEENEDKSIQVFVPN